MKKNKCEICGKYNGKVFKSDIFGKVHFCDKCIREYGGVKRTIESYELGNVILVK